MYSSVIPGLSPRGSRNTSVTTENPYGAEGDRTPDLCNANAALSHLSYSPAWRSARRLPGRNALLCKTRTVGAGCPDALKLVSAFVLSRQGRGGGANVTTSAVSFRRRHATPARRERDAHGQPALRNRNSAPEATVCSIHADHSARPRFDVRPRPAGAPHHGRERQAHPPRRRVRAVLDAEHAARARELGVARRHPRRRQGGQAAAHPSGARPHVPARQRPAHASHPARRPRDRAPRRAGGTGLPVRAAPSPRRRPPRGGPARGGRVRGGHRPLPHRRRGCAHLATGGARGVPRARRGEQLHRALRRAHQGGVGGAHHPPQAGQAAGPRARTGGGATAARRTHRRAAHAHCRAAR